MMKVTGHFRARDVLWSARSSNTKTGDVPTAWIGRTRFESKVSCLDCPLLANGSCYAQFGTPAIAHSSMIAAADRGKSRTMMEAINGRSPTARMLRVGAIGEPGRLHLSWWRAVRAAATAAKLDVLAYTHQWRNRPDLAKHSMASCDTLAEADEAIAMGYRATVVLPADHVTPQFKTPGGAIGIICPAIQSKILNVKKPVTCNSCRLCDGAKKGPVIGFPDHGPKVRKYTRAQKKQKEAVAA